MEKSVKKYPHLSDEDSRLKALCYEQLKSEYGEDPAAEATERLEKELSVISAFELSGVMLILTQLVKEAGLRKYEISVRGTFGASFAAWLCGLSPMNPLKTSLTLYPEFCFGYHWDQEPVIEICVPDGKTETLYDILNGLEGVEDVTSTEPETDQTASFGRCIIPEGETAASIQCPEKNNPYFVLRISPLTQLKLLERCVELTGTEPETISLDDKDVWSFFKQKEHHVTPDVSMFKTELYGIRGFFALLEHGIENIPLQTFSDLVRADSLLHSTGVWNNNQDALVFEQKTPVSDLITCREDVYEFCRDKLGIDPETAFQASEKVRKGRGVPQELKDQIDPDKQPMFEKFKTICDKTRYLWIRAHSYEQTVTAWRCAWYRVHYPAEFYQAYFETVADPWIAEAVLAGKTSFDRLSQCQESEKDPEPEMECNYNIDLAIAEEMYFLGIDLSKNR